MGVLAALAWLVATGILSWCLVRVALGYARRHAMLDLPGRRRSHQVPTPRGGGIGLLGALLPVSAGALWSAWPAPVVLAWLTGLVLVAWIGWRDDRHGVGVLPRLGVQLAAVLLFSVVLLYGATSWWWLVLLLPAGASSINLHNFMDGIDGLLALQAAFVGAGLALLALAAGAPALAFAAGALATSALGFWMWNRAPARIFMGDVGSGSVGFAIFALTALLWLCEPRLVWPALILDSAFVVDAGMTLGSRMLRGRRWYAPHREHVYQWLVRRGAGHGAVTLGYLAWNLVLAAPLAWLAVIHPHLAVALTMAACLIAALAWLMLKHRLVRRCPHRNPHAAA